MFRIGRMTRLKNVQAAQGMVEFALVLPILLLVILGVFGFGHLFFAYSSVVSASREAARWGAAAGVAGSSRPRYYDCPAIRAAAVRVGNFAGVTDVDATPGQPGIAIWFDHGPNDVTAAYPGFDDCADNHGPSNVSYGDRINVSITVNYHSIVPLVNIPDFALSAVTARTIVKNLPVGEAPTAEPVCPTTNIVMEFVPVPMPAILPASPVVGQPVDVYVKVTASDHKSPTGTVDINDDSSPHLTCSVASNSTTWQVCHLVPKDTYMTTATHLITARYAWDNHGQCYQPSEIIDEPLTVIKADTVTTVTKVQPDPSLYPYQNVVVTVSVAATNPGSGTPTGKVIVSDQTGNSCAIEPITMGGGQCILSPGPESDVNIVAMYQGDTNYKPSTSNPFFHHVVPPPTLTPTITPTKNGGKASPTPTVTMTPKPTNTPKVGCPSLAQGSVSFSTYGLRFEVLNTGGTNTSVSSVELTWPDSRPSANWKEVDFDTANPPGAVLSVASKSNAQLPPTQATVDSSTTNWTWSTTNQGLTTTNPKYMQLVFSDPLPSGFYFVTVNFANGCSLDVFGIH